MPSCAPAPDAAEAPDGLRTAVTSPAEPRWRERDAPKLSLCGKSLIVADADHRVRELLVLLLREEGAVVREADSRGALLELLDSVEQGLVCAELLLCDDSLPACPLHVVQGRLRSMRAAPGLLVVTARSPSYQAGGIERAVLYKPFRIAELFAVVHAALRIGRP